MKAVNLAQHRRRRAEEAFDAYREASLKAQQSLDINDGIAAGKPWRAFLELFLPPPRAKSDERSARVVKLKQRRGKA